METTPQLETGTYEILRHRLSKLSWLTVPLAVLMSSCGSADSDKPLPPAPTVTQQPPASTDADACLEHTKGFLRWYYRYFDRNDTSTRFINFPLTGEEDAATLAQVRGNISSTPYIQLNRRKLAVYLDTLRRSGYFSDSYLAALRASIVQRGQDLEEAKQPDGVPEGFDADEVMQGQDIYQPGDIDKLAAYQPANLKPGTLAYRLHLLSECEGCADFSWYFYLKRENGRCVVDSIKTE